MAAGYKATLVKVNAHDNDKQKSKASGDILQVHGEQFSGRKKKKRK